MGVRSGRAISYIHYQGELEPVLKCRPGKNRDDEEEDTYEQDIMILWFRSEILEYTLFPESFHVVPVLNHAVFDRIVEIVRSKTVSAVLVHVSCS